jgi:hypothetical protein
LIIILNGPLGVGKTETAWKLIECFDQAAILDCDYVGGNVSTFDFRNPDSFRRAIESLVVLARHQQSAMGITDFVVSGVFEKSEQLSFAKLMLSKISEPVIAYLLLAKPDALERRVRKRMNGDMEREIARANELSNILYTSSNDLGKPFDTSSLTVDEAADQLWNDILLSK